MSNGTKTGLIIAVSLVVLGLVIFAGVMALNHWDFSELNTVKYQTNTYQVSEEFNNISMKTDTADILFLPSDNEICKVVCYEEAKENHAAAVQDGTLTINAVNEKKWYEYIGIAWGTPKITVYLPGKEYAWLLLKGSTGDIEIPKDFKFESMDISISTGDVKNDASVSELIKIKTSTGDICIENVVADALDLSVSTGKVIAEAVTCQGDIKINVSTGDTKLTDVACNAIISRGSTGDISLNKVVAAEKFLIERSTGDVKFEGCDAAEIFVKTDTGSVKGTLLSEKVFITETSTGDVNVPKTVTGGKCEINTDTGNIKIAIKD